MRAISSLVALAVLAGGVSVASADDSGLASMHAWRNVGGKTCFVDHTHEGSGSGPTQDTAMKDAIKSWQGFTDLEYGSVWASYSNSVGKSASCSKGSSTVTCQISSTPCKNGSMGRKRG
jgi:hypothetical protein